MFSNQVKKELLSVQERALHCRLARLSAIVAFYLTVKDNSIIVRIKDENEAKYSIKLLENIKNIKYKVIQNKTLCEIHFKEENAVRLLEVLKLDKNKDYLPSSIIYQSNCCKMAFIRGIYMCCGSITNPNSSYHLELNVQNEVLAKQLISILSDLEVNAHMSNRKSQYLVYIKEAESIAEILRIMKCSISLMELENTRIEKQVRNNINRRVNFEASNIRKSAKASVKQIQAIELIKEKGRLNDLKEQDIDLAEMRLKYPEATLTELGAYFNPTLSKSCVNHRLRKIIQLAEELR